MITFPNLCANELISFYCKNIFPNISSSLFFLTEPFQYTGWELNIDDYDEETEDYQAEAEIDEDVEEEEEEEEEVRVFYYCFFTWVTSLKVDISGVITSTLRCQENKQTSSIL